MSTADLYVCDVCGETRPVSEAGWTVPTGVGGCRSHYVSILGPDDVDALIDHVRKLRECPGMDDDLVARQVVDDHYRATGVSFHHQQHIVETIVGQIPRSPD